MNHSEPTTPSSSAARIAARDLVEMQKKHIAALESALQDWQDAFDDNNWCDCYDPYHKNLFTGKCDACKCAARSKELARSAGPDDGDSDGD